MTKQHGEEGAMATSSVICHPDKVETRLLLTERNAATMTSQIEKLIYLWSDREQVLWMDRRKTLNKDNDRWIKWELTGRGPQIRIDVGGWAFHLRELLPRARTFLEHSWWQNPFPTPEDISRIYKPRRISYLGWIRVTDECKTDPHNYVAALTRILQDIASLGIEEFPSTVELALDTTDSDTAEILMKHARLIRGSDVQLSHSNPDIGRRNRFPGPSPTGLTEYQQRNYYLARSGRDLHIYERDGFVRTEIRLKRLPLWRYYKSTAFKDALEQVRKDHPGTTEIITSTPEAPTLQILCTAERLVKRNLTLQELDVEAINREHDPRSRLWQMSKKSSIRAQRSCLRMAGLSSKDIGKYSRSLPFPPVHYILPGHI
ncbi:hypothetical protein ACFL2Q_00150 [Thermodesulfobacteriota bacterium]